jgi:hypothetical protein
LFLKVGIFEEQGSLKTGFCNIIGAFDVNLNAGGSMNLAGYYDGRTGYAMLEQPLPVWGGSVYGGYRLSSGFLPNYNKDRTGVDGEGVLGFRLPLLRDGTIDRRRASLWQAQIDQELADPIILRQYLDFIRSATISYYNWLAAGQRLALTEHLLRIAEDRDSAIAEQVKRGASAPIVQIDNQLRLILFQHMELLLFSIYSIFFTLPQAPNTLKYKKLCSFSVSYSSFTFCFIIIIWIFIENYF